MNKRNHEMFSHFNADKVEKDNTLYSADPTGFVQPSAANLIQVRGFSPTAEQSLPLGNGLIGANVWIEEDGIIRMLLSHAEAYSETSRLSKVGEVHLSVDHAALRAGEILQTLNLEKGILRITSLGESKLEIILLADSLHPALRISIRSETPLSCHARVMLSRPERRVIPRSSLSTWSFEEGSSFVFIDPSITDFVIEPDTFVPTTGESVSWCHRNPNSFLKMLAAKDDEIGVSDPLDGLTFGAFMKGPGWHRDSYSCLRNTNPRQDTDFSITLHANKCESIEHWLVQIESLAGELETFEVALGDRSRFSQTRAQNSFIRLKGTAEAEQVSLAYASQVYLSDCAGRGKWPIRFNGSMFNVAWKVEHPNGNSESYDADYRRWHCGFWGQNTRLIYWPMLANGQFDLMRPYFDLYRDTLPAARHRARLFLGREGRGGAYFWETVNFWDNLEVAVLPKKNTTWMYFHSSLEMLMMAFDYLEFTGNQDFLQTHLSELASSILDFYLDAGSIDGDGKYRLISFSTETYHNAVNAAPDIAGLRAVLPRVIGHLGPDVPSAKLCEWQELLIALPELSRRDAQGALPMMLKEEELYSSLGTDVRARTANQPTWVIAPAAELPHAAWNVENPEIYPIFPFRQLGVGQDGLQLARDTYLYRRFQHDNGWAQDPIVAARIGMVEEAKTRVIARSGRIHPGAKFPAFWEASFDWIPDQDNGGVFTIALQMMLLQWNENDLYLLPCWPKEWDVSFRLHAPYQTIVEGAVRAGKLAELTVTPEIRLRDIRLGEDYVFPPNYRTDN